MPSITAKTENTGTLQQAADGVQHAAHEAGRKIRSIYDTASDELSHASDTVTTEIRENPVRSSMIALGVGIVLGTLLRR